MEGYSHPLWLGLLSLARPLPFTLAALPRAFGLASLGAIFVVWARARLAPELLLVLVSFPGLVLWSLGGPETTFVSLLLLTGFVEAAALLDPVQAGRPDRPVVFALAYAGASEIPGDEENGEN